LLSGGEGRDRLSGGEGRDRFGLTLTRSSRDVITDFSSADDTVSIAIGSVKKIKIGGLLRRQFKLGRAAGDRDDRFIYNRGSGALFFDADGSGRRGAIQIASFTNRPTLTAADIVITR
jgi:Ca2+-binding RTX toxin-like protein